MSRDPEGGPAGSASPHDVPPALERIVRAVWRRRARRGSSRRGSRLRPRRAVGHRRRSPSSAGAPIAAPAATARRRPGRGGAPCSRPSRSGGRGAPRRPTTTHGERRRSAASRTGRAPKKAPRSRRMAGSSPSSPIATASSTSGCSQIGTGHFTQSHARRSRRSHRAASS